MLENSFTVKEIKQFYNMTRFDNLRMVLKKGIESKLRREGYMDMADSGVMAWRSKKRIDYTNPLTENSGRKKLWRLANLYLNPHNSTLWTAYHTNERRDMIIFCVSRSILERGDIILTDRNAASNPATFFTSEKFKITDEDAVYLTRDVSITKEELALQTELANCEVKAKMYRIPKKKYLIHGKAELAAKEQASLKAFGDKYEYSQFFRSYDELKERANRAKHTRQAEALARTRIDPRFITGVLVADEDQRKNVETVLLDMDRADIKVTVSPSMFWLNENGQAQSSLPLSPPPVAPDSTMLTSWLADPRNKKGVPGDISDSESLEEVGDVAIAYFLADPALIKRLRVGKLGQDELNLNATIAGCFSESVRRNHQAFIVCVKTNDDKTVSLSQIAKVFVFSLPGKKLFRNLTKTYSFNVEINPNYFPLDKGEVEASKVTQLKVLSGNVINSKMPVVVNTVNCVGVMGAGIALAFRNRFPAMYSDYKKRCRDGELVLGRPYLWQGRDKWVINFPTKGTWKAKSQIEDIVDGLDYLAKNLEQWGVTRLAIPALGCNNGGLDFKVIRPLIETYLRPLNIELEIYEPIVTKSPKHQKRKLPSGFFQSDDRAKKARKDEWELPTFSASV